MQNNIYFKFVNIIIMLKKNLNKKSYFKCMFKNNKVNLTFLFEKNIIQKETILKVKNWQNKGYFFKTFLNSYIENILL